MRVFHPNCTLPSEPSFVSSPNTRGTLSIVWSCLTVLILCTWSIQHPNLPIQYRRQTFWQMIQCQLHQALRKVKFMFFTILMPEFFAGMAVEEVSYNYRLTKDFNKIKMDYSARWSLTHTFFSQMGGFQLRFSHPLLAETTQLTLSGTHESLQTHVLSHAPRPRPELPESKHTDGNSTSLQLRITQEEPLKPDEIPPEDVVPTWNSSRTRSDAMDHTASLHSASSDMECGSNQSSIPLARPNQGLSTSSADELRKKATEWLSQTANDRGLVNPVAHARHLSSRYGHLDWDSVFQVEVMHAMEDLSCNEYKAQAMLFLQGNIWMLDAPQLLKAHEMGLIKNLPDVTEEELKDKSKSDILVKILAVIQGLWLVVQVISRSTWTPTLHSSQLEIGTIAVALCMLPIYVTLWHKPQNVSTAVVIHADRAPTDHDITTIASARNILRRQRSFVVPFGMLDNAVEVLSSESTITICIPIFGVLLGVVHFAAWNFAFPTPTEALLWKIAAGLTTGLPIVIIGMVVFVKHDGTFPAMIFLILLGVYGITRIFIVVEMFRCLYYLPPNAYIATWASEIPSIA